MFMCGVLVSFMPKCKRSGRQRHHGTWLLSAQLVWRAASYMGALVPRVCPSQVTLQQAQEAFEAWQ